MAKSSPSAAGAPLALAILAGATIGSILHRSVLGAVVGVIVGVAIAVLVWLVDRRRIGH